MNELILGIFSIVSVLLIFLSFLMGLHYGSKIRNNEVINKPTINPIKMVKNRIEDSKEEERLLKEKEVEDIILTNIENYDGTGLGQIDIPR